MPHKKYWILLVVVLVIIAITKSTHFMKRNADSNYGFEDLSAPDCSALKNGDNSSVNLSFNATDVSLVREKIKTLALKYNAEIQSDSFNSYPTYPPMIGSPTPMPMNQDSANLNLYFKTGQKEFLNELSGVVKAAGAIDAGYNYSGNNSPYGYSSYSSCLNMMQNVASDKLQLNIFTDALGDERDPQKVALIGQAITNVRNNLQNDIRTVNEMFKSNAKPLVTININSSIGGQ